MFSCPPGTLGFGVQAHLESTPVTRAVSCSPSWRTVVMTSAQTDALGVPDPQKKGTRVFPGLPLLALAWGPIPFFMAQQPSRPALKGSRESAVAGRRPGLHAAGLIPLKRPSCLESLPFGQTCQASIYLSYWKGRQNYFVLARLFPLHPFPPSAASAKHTLIPKTQCGEKIKPLSFCAKCFYWLGECGTFVCFVYI